MFLRRLGKEHSGTKPIGRRVGPMSLRKTPFSDDRINDSAGIVSGIVSRNSSELVLGDVMFCSCDVSVGVVSDDVSVETAHDFDFVKCFKTSCRPLPHLLDLPLRLWICVHVDVDGSVRVPCKGSCFSNKS